jgi:hypothetical protein
MGYRDRNGVLRAAVRQGCASPNLVSEAAGKGRNGDGLTSFAPADCKAAD